MATIAGIATSDARFNILVQALQFVDAQLPGSNLVAALSSASANLTVFAPTDTAFGRLAADLGFTGNTSNEAAVVNFLTTNVTAETLRDVLTYHVSQGAKTLAQIAANPTVQTLSGETITADAPTLVDREPDLLNPSLIQTDVRADNGIVHVIDRVLLPVDLPGNDAPTITGIVAASGAFDNNRGDFDLLLRAVQTAGLADTLNNANADLTVFAPNDAAFFRLATALGFQGGNEQAAFNYTVEALTLLSGGGNPVPLLRDILTYHVSPESLQASQVLSRASIDTLLGPDLGRNGTRLVDADPDLPNPQLIRTDIQAANGIVHVIDGVLIPANILQSDGANDVDFVIAGNGADAIFTHGDRDFVDGNGGADAIFLGRGNDVALGGGGADFLTGGLGNDTISGQADADIILAGQGRDRVSGGTGNDLLFGGADRDVFVFATQGGQDRVLDFSNGADKLDVRGLGIDSFSDLTIRAVNNGEGATINLGTNGRITFDSVTVAQLDASDFIFA